MKSIIAVLMLFAVAGCSGQDANLSVSTSAATVSLIPSSAASCLAIKTAGTSGASPDISAAYFRIPKVTFVKKNPANNMYIAQIKINISNAGNNTSYECRVGGDALSALSSDSNWWGSGTTHDTLITAGLTSFTTDCPLYCGGVDAKVPFNTTATMEITGYEQAPNDDNQTPVKVQSYFNIDNQ